MATYIPYSFTALIDTDSDGDNTIASQAVAVRAESTGFYETIYSDEGITPIAQPGAITDSDGVLEFYVLAGWYTITSIARTETVLIDDSLRINPESLAYAVIRSQHYKIGDFIDAKGRVSKGDGGGGKWEVIDATTSPGNSPNEFDIVTGNGAISFKIIMNGQPLNIKSIGGIADGSTSIINAITAALAINKTIFLPSSSGSYLFDVDSKSLFDKEVHLIFGNGAQIEAAIGVTVHGNSCTVQGDLSKHFKSPDYDAQWLTSTSYTVGNVIQFGYGRYYKCTSNHTSGTWITDKATKWVAFQPFSFFQRSEGDGFVYPEWFGAKADNTTLSSVGWAHAMSCNSVSSGISLIDNAGSITNGYYKLDRPFVFLNGRTVTGGESTRAYVGLRLDGISGNEGFKTEEFETGLSQGFGYSSIINIRFEIENIVNTSFNWCKFFFLETALFEQCTWQSYGTCTVREICEFQGGPITISDLNMMYDDGTDLVVEEYPMYLNCFGGLRMGNINYQVPGGKKGLKIRPGRMTEIDTIFHETSPTTAGEASLFIEQSGDSNGCVKSVNLNNKKAGALGLEIDSNSSLSSYNSNFKLQNIQFRPHDGIGMAFTDILKINGVNYPKTFFDAGATSTIITIDEISKNKFTMGGLRSHFANEPIGGSQYYPTMAGSATVSVPFSPVLKQGIGNNNAWCGLMQVCARGGGGTEDRGYLTFLSLVINNAGAVFSSVTDIVGTGRWTVVWNNTSKSWDITNNITASLTEVIITFTQQGPSLFTIP